MSSGAQEQSNAASGREKSAFAFLTREDEMEFRSYLASRQWPAGSLVIDSGQRCDFMGFLLEGALAVKKETGFPGKFVSVALLTPGAMVGEGSVLGDIIHTARVETMERSRMLILSRDAFEELLANNPGLGVKVLRRISHVLLLRLRKAGERLAWVL